ncbi:MAG: pacearchaeosortase [Nanoarchaeota archaeon]
MKKESKKDNKFIIGIFIRYLFLLLVSIGGLYIFYLVFTPLTVYSVFFLASLFFKASVSGNIVHFGNGCFDIVYACVAGSAYYLLLVLNLSIPNIPIKKRLMMIFSSFLLLLLLNILRIFFLGILFSSNLDLFNLAHKVLWYFLSTIFIIGIWFIEVAIFKIKGIPFYSDIKFLYKLIKNKSF